MFPPFYLLLTTCYISCARINLMKKVFPSRSFFSSIFLALVITFSASPKLVMADCDDSWCMHNEYPCGIVRCEDCYPCTHRPPGEVEWDSLFDAVQSEPDPLFNMQTAKLGDIVNELVPYIFSLAGFLLLIYLTFGGFSLMTSGGNPKVKAAAQQKITYAILGFVIVFLAYWIVVAVARILAIPQTRSPFPL